MGRIKSSSADHTHSNSEGDIDSYTLSVPTDAEGEGSAVLEFDQKFKTDVPRLLVHSRDGNGGWSSRSASDVTVTVSSGPVDGEAEVTVLAIGSRVDNPVQRREDSS